MGEIIASIVPIISLLDLPNNFSIAGWELSDPRKTFSMVLPYIARQSDETLPLLLHRVGEIATDCIATTDGAIHMNISQTPANGICLSRCQQPSGDQTYGCSLQHCEIGSIGKAILKMSALSC
jgi:hypothetical protein